MIGGKHGVLQLAIPAEKFFVDYGSTSNYDISRWTFGAGGGHSVIAPIDVRAGTRIQNLRWYLGSADNTIEVRLSLLSRPINATTAESSIDYSGSIYPTSAYYQVTRTVDFVTAVNTAYYLRLYTLVPAGVTLITFGGAILDVSRP